MLRHRFLACSNDPVRGAFQAHQTQVTLGWASPWVLGHGGSAQKLRHGPWIPRQPGLPPARTRGEVLTLSRLTPACVLFPDCDTGVKRPIGGDGQEVVQPGTVVKTRTL